jgi:hypothetical protein
MMETVNSETAMVVSDSFRRFVLAIGDDSPRERVLLVIGNSENPKGEEGTPHAGRFDSFGERREILQMEGKHETN